MAKEIKSVKEIVQNADFESAIEATGFGVFNVLLICATLPSMFAIMCDTASASYVIASGAECELHLSIQIKGAVNSAIYGGMILAAIPWSYIADTFGRKPVIAYGLLLDAISVIFSAMSHNWIFLFVCRFLSGACVAGPFAVLYTYLVETNPLKMRHPIIFVVGTSLSIGALLLPLLAMWILPAEWEIDIFGMKYHSWHLFLMVCAIPGLIAGISFLFFPESPKYLMSQGRNDEALACLTSIYNINHRSAESEYPIKSLAIEKIEFKMKDDGTELSALQKAKQQFIDVIFSRAYIFKTIMMFIISFCVMMCENTVRLWVPQILKLSNVMAHHPELDQSFREIFVLLRNQSHSMNRTSTSCSSVTTLEDYVKNLYVAVAGIGCFFVAIAVVNIVGIKLLLSICLGLGSILAPLLWISPNESTNIICLTAYLCMVNVASSNMVAVTTSLFPTQVRATIVSAAQLLGRAGSLLGNQLFPVLVDENDLAPILFITLFTVTALVTSIFVPSSAGKKLK